MILGLEAETVIIHKNELRSDGLLLFLSSHFLLKYFPFKNIYFYVHGCLACVSVCEGQKEASELGSQTVVSCHIGTGN